MLNKYAFTGVGVAGMPRPLQGTAASAHPAFLAHAAAPAAAITPERKRRTAAATGQSVDRGTT